MRSAALATVLLLGIAAPAVADSNTTSLQTTTIKGYKETVKTTTEGTSLNNKVRVLGGAPRQVQIQYSSDGSTWVTTKTRTTDEIGKLRFAVKVKPDRNRWRLSVPATSSHSAATSAVKTYAVQLKESVSPTVPVPAITDGQIAASKAYARSYILSTYGWAMTSGSLLSSCGSGSRAGTTRRRTPVPEPTESRSRCPPTRWPPRVRTG